MKPLMDAYVKRSADSGGVLVNTTVSSEKRNASAWSKTQRFMRHMAHGSTREGGLFSKKPIKCLWISK